MFPLPYRSPIDALLCVVFGLELALLVGGLAFGKLNAEQTGRLPLPLRMSLSVMLVLAAILGWVDSRGSAAAMYALLILLGMAAGFVGDLIMARLIRVPVRLIFGMLAFGIGHVFYIAAFLRLATQSGLSWSWLQALLIIAVLAFALWAWHTFVRKPGGSKAINVGSLVYGLLIGAMTALALALAIHGPQYIPMAAGALLFLASDFVLGNWVVRGHTWKSVNDVVWVTYVLGQLLIVYSVGAVLNVLR